MIPIEKKDYVFARVASNVYTSKSSPFPNSHRRGIISSVEVVFVVDVNDNYIIKNDAQTLACIAFKVVQFLMLALYKLISNVNPSFLEFKTRYCITPLFAGIFEDDFTFLAVQYYFA